MKKYQNITLALPKDILIKVKHIAIDRQTSVTGLLATILEEMVQKEDAYAKAKRHYLDFLSCPVSLCTNGEVSWKRDELYER